MSWRDRATPVAAPTGAPSASGWRSRARAVPTDDAPAAVKTGVLKGLQGLTRGFSEEIGAGLGAGAQAVVNALPERAQAALDVVPADPKDAYTYIRDESRREEKAGATAHPMAATLGTVAGIAGAIASGGPRGLGGAALEGAASGLGSSEADLTKGEVKRALVDTGAGAGTGLATYGAVKGLGAVAQRALPALGRVAKSFAGERALSAAGTMKGSRNALARKGLLDQAKAFLLDEGVVSPFAGVEKVRDRLGAIRGEAGEQIGKAIGEIDNMAQFGPARLGRGISGEDLARKVEQELVKPAGANPGSATAARSLQGLADDLRAQGPTPINMRRLADWIRSYDAPAKFDAAKPKESAQAARAVRQLLREAFDAQAISAEKALGRQPMALQGLRDARQKYALASELGDAAQDRVAGWGANRFFGLTDAILGGSGGVAGMAAGGPFGGLVASIGSAAANKILRTYGAGTTAVVANLVSKALAQGQRINPEALAAAIARASGQPTQDVRRQLADALAE